MEEIPVSKKESKDWPTKQIFMRLEKANNISEIDIGLTGDLSRSKVDDGIEVFVSPFASECK